MPEPKHEIARWNPFRDLDALNAWAPLRDLPFGSRLSRLVDQTFGEAAPGPAIFAIDVTESDEAYIVNAELPGVRKEDVTIECQDGVISIRGEKKSEREEKKDRSRLLERTYGMFSRSLALPPDVDTEKVKASFLDGVLRVEIPKRPEAKPKTIAIK